MAVSIALVATMWQGGWAQPSCANLLMSLAPCFSYLITGGSLVPSSLCCSQLNWVIQNQPECPCALVNGGGAVLGIVANQTLSLTIPSACNLQNPSVSLCNFVSSATVGSQPSQTSNSSSPEAESKTVSSTNNISSGATVTKSPFCVALPLYLFLVILVLVLR